MVANLSSIGGIASSCRRFSASFMPPRAPNETGPVTHEESNALGSDFISFDQSDESHVEESESEPEPVVVDDTVREHASARSTPWAQHVPWHKCRNVSEMLCEEVRTYTEWISPTKEEHATRTMVIALLQRALCSRWPDAEVYSFGSQDTELYLPQGDIDLVVLSKAMDSQSREGTLREIASCLRSHKLATNIQVIGRAKVPIIKFVCPYGHFHIDISINQANGLQTAHFINRWLQKQPALRPLIMVVKQFLQQRALSEVFTGGLGSYSVTLMVLSFLQVHPKLQRGEMPPEQNLGALLMEFFELYGKNFGYDECAITVRGRGGYVSKRQRGFFDPRKPFMLSIEDPHDPEGDVSKGSFAIISVRSALGGAFDILHAALCERSNDLHNFRRRQRLLYNRQMQSTHVHFDADASDNRLHLTSQIKEPESLLGSVLGVSREMIRRRNEIKQLYDSEVLQKLLDIPVDSTPSAPAVRVNAPGSLDASDDSIMIHAQESIKRRVHPDEQDTPESKYDAKRPKKRAMQDPWSSRVQSVPSDTEEEELMANDAPYVAVSSDSDGPSPAPVASTPVKTQGLRIAGRAKQSKLSKKDRLQYWHNKASAT